MLRSILPLLLTGLFALAAASIHEPDQDRSLERVRAHLQRDIDMKAIEAQDFVKELGAQLAEHGGHAWMNTHAASLEITRERSGLFFLGYMNDSLVCWSGQPMIRPGRLVGDRSGQIHTSTGSWLHVWWAQGSVELHGFLPIWRAPPIENRYLEQGFHPSLGAPVGIQVRQVQGTEQPILRDAQAAPMLELFWREGAQELGPWLTIKLCCFVLAWCLLVVAAWYLLFGQWRRSPWSAFLLFAVFLALVRIGIGWSITDSPYLRLALFDPTLYASSAGFASLGELMINVLLFTVLVRAFQQAAAGMAMRPSLSVQLILWILVYATGLWVVRTIVGVVDHSSIELDLRHIQDMGVYSLVAVLCAALLLIGWTALVHSSVKWLEGQGPADLSRFIPVLVFAGLALVSFTAGMVHSVLAIALVSILVIITLGPHYLGRFGYGVAIVVLLSALTTHVLDSRNQLREKIERRSLAERVASREDPVLEQMFRDVAPRLGRDERLYAMITGKLSCNPGDLDRQVRQRFFNGYWERYDIRLFTFNTSGRAVCATDADSPRSFSASRTAFDLPTAASDMPDLFIEEQPGQRPFYHARVAVMPTDTLPPAQLIVELYPRSAVRGLGFPALLLAGDDGLARKVGRYDYARYENGQLEERAGGTENPITWTRSLGADGALWYTEGGVERLALGDPNGTVVVLGRPLPGLLDRATGFSYLFAFFSLLLVLLNLVHKVVSTQEWPRFGLSAKIRMALTLFALTSSIFFGVGAQLLLARQFEQQFEQGMIEKARSVHQDLQQRLDARLLGTDHARYLEHLLGRLSNVHFSDITLYSLEGRMVATSRPQMFVAGLLGRRMDPVAYERLALAGLGSFVHEEAIGTAAYRAAYLPLTDRNGNLLAYLALPGFADQDQRERDRAGVWVAVANLFVLLFALSVLIALFISNWTTRPLDLLKRSLSTVELQRINAPLAYRGRDEVGQLVEVYNRKVEELRESADKLARSERESAWKEMARQVAHEIKNPLTPMKLNIQHFQRTWDPRASDARERLDRFSNNLVEQIDALSRIAGEFSHFAQMPPAHPSTIDLAEVARTSVQLFAQTPGCVLHLSAPSRLMVHADREHLLRTFNNLIKNATQSFPDGREGVIEVIIRAEGSEAIAEVRDNGSGIAAETLDHVFVPRFTTKSSGMGLGLPMVKRMVENAGGRVWFETKEGVGSTFFVALPLRS